MKTLAPRSRSLQHSITAANIAPGIALGGLSFACFAVVTPCAPAGASILTLSNNLSAPIDGTEIVAGDRLVAASFSTRGYTNNLQLQTITLLMSMHGKGQAQLDLYTSISGQPGILAASLTAPTSFTPVVGPSIFSANSLLLQQDATYWAVLRATSGRFSWAWTRSSQGSGTGFLGSWGVSENEGFSWSSFSSEPMLMKVAATSPTRDVPGPLPALGAAFAIGFGRRLRLKITSRTGICSVPAGGVHGAGGGRQRPRNPLGSEVRGEEPFLTP